MSRAPYLDRLDDLIRQHKELSAQGEILRAECRLSCYVLEESADDLRGIVGRAWDARVARLRRDTIRSGNVITVATRV
jgi:hypothetical protein